MTLSSIIQIDERYKLDNRLGKLILKSEEINRNIEK